MNRQDTIIAPATPPGEGGISIIRLSGTQSLFLLSKFFKATGGSDRFFSHHLYHGHIYDSLNNKIDEVMAVFMASPHSYTSEDVVEIHCHGSRHIVRRILQLFQNEGVRLAEPGEFTYRAFMNGRLDLSQAEAVARLIHSSNESSRKIALSQVEGALSKKLYEFNKLVKKSLVLIEAWIDFPEEDLPEEDLVHIKQNLLQVRDEISLLVNSYQIGRVLNEGVNLVLVGKPNVGKSSLMNALLGEDRAIVTDIPGTTRDILEDGLMIDDIPVRIFDTAGLRQSDDPVEREGIRRAEEKITRADLVLILIDSSRPLDSEDHYILNKCCGFPSIVVYTKCDLTNNRPLLPVEYSCSVEISVKTSDGLDRLKTALHDFFIPLQQLDTDSILLSERRHYDSLIGASEYLDNAINLLGENSSLEFLAFELRQVLDCFGLITGTTTTEDILDDIFSGFCIGK